MMEKKKIAKIAMEMCEKNKRAVREIARNKDMPYQTLLRQWIAERIQQERVKMDDFDDF